MSPEEKKERDKFLFILAALFRAAGMMGTGDRGAISSYEAAESQLREAEVRGIDPGL